MRKPLANALDIDLQGGLTEQVTPHAGVALLIELGRRSGVMAAAERHLPAKRSAKGLGQGQVVESFVLLSALGGECVDDFDHLRRDYGLAALVGYHLPAASTARQWLDQFHDAEAVAARPLQGSFIPRESDRLAGLQAVVRRTVEAYGAVQQPGPEVTLDVDAHLVESAKGTALPTYEGFRGYPPEAGVLGGDRPHPGGRVSGRQRPRRQRPGPRGRRRLRDPAATGRGLAGASTLGLSRLRAGRTGPLGGAGLDLRRERGHDTAATGGDRGPAA